VICAGASITLDANPSGGAGPYTFLWNTGATSQAITVSPASTTAYSATVTGATGCTASSSETVTVNPDPAPAISEFCSGLNIILNAGSGYSAYLWSTGATAQTINIGGDTTSTYAVTVTDANGCQGPGSYSALGGCATPPNEPSSSGSPDPLRVLNNVPANQILVEVENVTGEIHYVVYEGALGAWYGAPSRGCLAMWTDLGATVQLNYPIAPGDRWVVVSAANAAWESSCGADSSGAERNAQPGWPAVGPCPP
jgi:hypothetical protein